MHTRRNVIRSIAVGAVLSSAPQAKPNPPRTIEICRKEAGQLAEAMQAICGGQWRVSVDKNFEFVLISKIL